MSTHLHFMGHAACGVTNATYADAPTCGNCRRILERQRSARVRLQSAQGAPGKTLYAARRHCPFCRKTINTARGRFVRHYTGWQVCRGSGEKAPTINSTQIGE